MCHSQALNPGIVSAPGLPGPRARRNDPHTVHCMRILESLTHGKHPDQHLCEDMLVLRPDLVAVIDGATDRTGRKIDFEGESLSSGLFAARVAAASLNRLPAGTDPIAAVSVLTHDFNAAVLTALGAVSPEDLPSASVVVYDDVLRVVWRLGDCSFRVDDRVEMGTKRIDQVVTDFRIAYLTALTSATDVVDPDVDAARELIRPLIRVQGVFANQPGEFGYGVLNGAPVPPAFIEIHPVPSAACDVVLASDGYPSLPADLATAEAALVDLLTRDPGCTQIYRNTKGLRPGNLSYDDRAWVRLRLD